MESDSSPNVAKLRDIKDEVRKRDTQFSSLSSKGKDQMSDNDATDSQVIDQKDDSIYILCWVSSIVDEIKSGRAGQEMECSTEHDHGNARQM